jgi:hypothetical protein
MSKQRGVASGGIALCFLLAGTGLAQAQEISRQRTEGSSTTEVRRISTVIGTQVSVESGTEVGKIVDFVINEDGCIDYLVMSSEDRFIVIPWTVATVDFSRHVVRVDITRDRLLEAPSFTRNNWSELSSARFTQKVRSFFGSRSERRGHRPGADTERRRDTDFDRRQRGTDLDRERRGTETPAPRDRDLRRGTEDRGTRPAPRPGDRTSPPDRRRTEPPEERGTNPPRRPGETTNPPDRSRSDQPQDRSRRSVNPDRPNPDRPADPDRRDQDRRREQPPRPGTTPPRPPER